jgi:hypothetical protein
MTGFVIGGVGFCNHSGQLHKNSKQSGNFSKTVTAVITANHTHTHTHTHMQFLTAYTVDFQVILFTRNIAHQSQRPSYYSGKYTEIFMTKNE